MQTQMLEKEATRAKFSVSVPANDVNKAYDAMLRTLARQVKIPGFRPGKAPRGVLEAKVGKDALAQEVRDALVETYYPRAVRELELAPVHAHFHAHEPVEGQDYSFEVEVDLYPEVTLPNLQDIVIDNEAPGVSDEMMRETIESLRRENAVLVPVDRPAEPGDYVVVESQSGNTLPIDLETAPPRLAEQLLGRSIGDAITLELSLGAPDEDELGEDEDTEGQVEGQAEAEASEEVSGEALETAPGEAGTEAGDAGVEDESAENAEINPLAIEVVVQDIKAKEKPEVGDEFAQTLGFDSWEETEGQIRRSLQAQLDEETFEAQREEFMDKLVAESDFDVPASLVNRRKRGLLENLARDLSERGITPQNYFEELDAKGNREAFELELDETARGAVKRDLVLERLMEVRGATLSDEEFSAALRSLARYRETDATKLRRDLGEEGLANYRFILTRDKTVRETVRELLGIKAGLEGEAANENPAEATAESADGEAAETETAAQPDTAAADTEDGAGEEARGA